MHNFAQSIKLSLKLLQTLNVAAHLGVDVLDTAVEICDLLGNIFQIRDPASRPNCSLAAGRANQPPRPGESLDLAVFGSTTYRVIQLGSCPVLAVHI